MSERMMREIPKSQSLTSHSGCWPIRSRFWGWRKEGTRCNNTTVMVVHSYWWLVLVLHEAPKHNDGLLTTHSPQLNCQISTQRCQETQKQDCCFSTVTEVWTENPLIMKELHLLYTLPTILSLVRAWALYLTSLWLCSLSVLKMVHRVSYSGLKR